MLLCVQARHAAAFVQHAATLPVVLTHLANLSHILSLKQRLSRSADRWFLACVHVAGVPCRDGALLLSAVHSTLQQQAASLLPAAPSLACPLVLKTLQFETWPSKLIHHPWIAAAEL
jgi:hypothetical protein